MLLTQPTRHIKHKTQLSNVRNSLEVPSCSAAPFLREPGHLGSLLSGSTCLLLQTLAVARWEARAECNTLGMGRNMGGHTLQGRHEFAPEAYRSSCLGEMRPRSEAAFLPRCFQSIARSECMNVDGFFSPTVCHKCSLWEVSPRANASLKSVNKSQIMSDACIWLRPC